MYGKLHLASIAGRSKDEPACTSLDESSLDGIRDDTKDTQDRRPVASSMDDAIVRFMLANQSNYSVLDGPSHYLCICRARTGTGPATKEK